jgi:hypothetical protein
MLDLKGLGEWTVEEIADEVLEAIPDESFWMKGAVSDGSKMCLLGAYSRVVFGSCFYLISSGGKRHLEKYKHLFLERLREVINEQFPGRVNDKNDTFHFVWRFNDRSCTTYEDVRLVLEKVRAG